MWISEKERFYIKNSLGEDLIKSGKFIDELGFVVGIESLLHKDYMGSQIVGASYEMYNTCVVEAVVECIKQINTRRA